MVCSGKEFQHWNFLTRQADLNVDQQIPTPLPGAQISKGSSESPSHFSPLSFSFWAPCGCGRGDRGLSIPALECTPWREEGLLYRSFGFNAHIRGAWQRDKIIASAWILLRAFANELCAVYLPAPCLGSFPSVTCCSQLYRENKCVKCVIGFYK